MSSKSICLNNFDLCEQIAGHLDVFELVQLELVSTSWIIPVASSFLKLRSTENYSYLTFKHRSDFPTDKSIVSRVFNNRQKASAQMLVIGGSFGSLHTESCMIQESYTALDGHVLEKATIPVHVGSTGACIDNRGRVVLIGGWDDDAEVPLSNVRDISLTDDLPWQETVALPRGLCFSTATCSSQGDLLVVGGGNSPYRGADVYNDCLIKRISSSNDGVWQENCVPSMRFHRCGHSAVTLLNDNVLIAGGYSGGEDYLNSVELLDLSAGGRWLSLPPMSVPRSGMAAVLGPLGSVYIAGGSTDGTVSHKSCERFDPREGKRWHSLANMRRARGYTAGCVGSRDAFFVSGGCNEHRFIGGVEVYDFRANKWTELASSTAVNDNNEEDEDEDEEANQFEEYLQRVCHQMIYIM